MSKPKLVVLTGAGISAESGLKTFRDQNGLWEGHDVMQVASPQGWQADAALVLEFYNQRRRQLLEVEPNAAHKALTRLEGDYDIQIITQNVDDLHERAGSKQIMHLHGELLKSRSTGPKAEVYDHKTDIHVGDLCPLGFQLRPHIVWFGEDVPLIHRAAQICEEADILLIVGTSMQVYPAAGLLHYVPRGCPIYYIDPQDIDSINSNPRILHIKEKATTGMQRFLEHISTT